MSKPAVPKFWKPAMWVVAIVAIAVSIAAGTGKFSTKRVRAAEPTGFRLAENAQPASVNGNENRQIRAKFDALPLAFEANQGQAGEDVKYVARGNGYKLYLSSLHATMAFQSQVNSASEVREMMMNKRRGAAAARANRLQQKAHSRKTNSVASLRMDFLGAREGAVVAQDRQPGKVNYFLGNDPSKWHPNIPLFGRVQYEQLYPGIDLAFRGESKELEFDYVVHPGADASSIALGFEGADRLNLGSDGTLMIATSAGAVKLHRPVAYQERNGQREIVDAWFVAEGNERIAFGLGAYDHNRELVIDPTVTYSTYFGGNGPDYGTGVAVDASGNAFICGSYNSSSIPGHPGASTGYDAFVTEITPTGSLVFTSVFGGAQDDFPAGIAVDSQGIYLAGTTDSSNFPVTTGAAQTAFMGGAANGNNDAFAVKLALNGSSITWGTFIAGGDSDSGLGIAVDGSHNVYVVGETFSNNLGGVVGGVNALQSLNLGQITGENDGYIAKLNANGAAYALVSYLGGTGGDLTTGVALDGSGNIYIAGETFSTDLPVTSGVVQGTCGTDATCNGSKDDAFVAAIKANLSGYQYVTYYGGSGQDDALAIAADSSGKAFLTGLTQSTDFPAAGSPVQSVLNGNQNAFVLELNSTGTVANYSSYLGGNSFDEGTAIDIDGSDNIYVTGQTASSSKFPLLNPTQSSLSGTTDAFVSVVSASQGHLLFSTYLGGSGDEDQLFSGIAVDGSGRINVTGDTDSSTFPTTTGTIDGTFGGGTCTSSSSNVPCPDAFVTAFGSALTPDFGLTATTPAAVNPGGSGSSTVTVTELNSDTQQVTLSCSVSGGGSPAPSCSSSTAFSTNPVTPSNSGATSTLTITTTGAAASLHQTNPVYFAMWLPIVGLALIGMPLSTEDARKKKVLGFLSIGVVMMLLFFLPACGGSGGGGGGGCPGCTPAGNYTVTITGTQGSLTHSTQVTLTVH